MKILWQVIGMVASSLLAGVGCFFVVGAVFSFLDPFARVKRKISSSIIYGASILTVIFALIYTSAKEFWGSNTIGDIFCKSEFTAYYYVEISRMDSNEYYMLPAKVRSFREEEIGRINKIERVHFNNGGYLYFGEYDYYDQTFSRDDTAVLTDQNGEKWYIRLTDEKIR